MTAEIEAEDPNVRNSGFYYKLFFQDFTIATAFLPKEFMCIKVEQHRDKSRGVSATSHMHSDEASDRALKGLKELSRKVKQLVWKKQPLTYRQVATHLICEAQPYLQSLSNTDRHKEEQNIKRRVYDALNVLIASDVLRKQGKRVSANAGQRAAQIQQLCKQISRISEKEQLREQTTRLEENILRLQERNRSADTSSNQKIPLPVCGVVVTPDYSVSRNGGTTKITCSETPIYFDEIEVFRRIVLS